MICSGCGHEIDPEVCWCGEPEGAHFAEHGFVPMGCDCGRRRSCSVCGQPEGAHFAEHRFTPQQAKKMTPHWEEAPREHFDSWGALRAHWDECAKNQPRLCTDPEKLILDSMRQQYEALVACGWQDIVYCPKDGTQFLAIVAGQADALRCHYTGEWPTGAWFVQDCGDLWPERPILWRPLR